LGGREGFPRSTMMTYRVVRFCLFPGGFIDLVYRESNDTPLPLAFWPKPISKLGLLILTRFIDNSHVLTMHPRLVPYRVLLLDIPFASRLRRVGYIVRRASDHILVACLRSLRLKVQPVCLMTVVISNNPHCDFVSHTSLYLPTSLSPQRPASG
jgi:hypothetical protein